MKRRREDAKGTFSSLSEEITRKFNDLQTDCETTLDSKRRWINELEGIVEKAYPDSSLVLVGSSMNMFGFKDSDCDLTLKLSGSIFASYNALPKIEKLLPKPRFKTEVMFWHPKPLNFGQRRMLVMGATRGKSGRAVTPLFLGSVRDILHVNRQL